MRTTLLLTAGVVALGIFCGWRGARPWDIRRGPRLMPWRFLMLLAAATAVALMTHVAALMGAPMRPVV